MPIVPTLSVMAEVYQLSRQGGPRSPRFTTYVQLAEHTLGLSGYNPMAGDAAAETVRALLAMDAEALAAAALQDVQARCAFDAEISLAIVVASAGMWTDRLATEVQHRTSPKRTARQGGIQLWTREEVSEQDVRREAAAESVRAIWTDLHGDANTIGKVLSREGFAYASPVNITAPSTGADVRVDEALGVLGDATNLGDIVALLYGDDPALQLGYTPLGLPDRAGFSWAATRAAALIEQFGVPHAIRANPNFVSM